MYAVSDIDAAYLESDLVCMTNTGKLCVFSLPQLRRQLCTDTVVSPDITRLEHATCSVLTMQLCNCVNDSAPSHAVVCRVLVCNFRAVSCVRCEQLPAAIQPILTGKYVNARWH